MIKKLSFKLIILSLISLILCSCSPSVPEETPPPPPDTVKLFLKNNPDIRKKLRSHHVTVYQRGDIILIVMPADEFFFQSSTNFNFSTLPTVKAIVYLINNFEVVDMRVVGYTDNIGPQIRNMALSREWAQIVAHDMWAMGLDARLVYATGYGEFGSIASNDTTTGRAQNRRIEISLRLPPPPFVY